MGNPFSKTMTLVTTTFQGIATPFSKTVTLVLVRQGPMRLPAFQGMATPFGKLQLVSRDIITPKERQNSSIQRGWQGGVFFFPWGKKTKIKDPIVRIQWQSYLTPSNCS